MVCRPLCVVNRDVPRLNPYLGTQHAEQELMGSTVEKSPLLAVWGSSRADLRTTRFRIYECS
jgi:hypothetical protein